MLPNPSFWYLSFPLFSNSCSLSIFCHVLYLSEWRACLLAAIYHLFTILLVRYLEGGRGGWRYGLIEPIPHGLCHIGQWCQLAEIRPTTLRIRSHKRPNSTDFSLYGIAVFTYLSFFAFAAVSFTRESLLRAALQRVQIASIVWMHVWGFNILFYEVTNENIITVHWNCTFLLQIFFVRIIQK